MSDLFEAGEVSDVSLKKLSELMPEVGEKLHLRWGVDEAQYLFQQTEVEFGDLQKQPHIHKGDLFRTELNIVLVMLKRLMLGFLLLLVPEGGVSLRPFEYAPDLPFVHLALI